MSCQIEHTCTHAKLATSVNLCIDEEAKFQKHAGLLVNKIDTLEQHQQCSEEKTQRERKREREIKICMYSQQRMHQNGRKLNVATSHYSDG